MKYKRIILLLFITGLLLIPFCEPDKKMLVETGDVSNISITTADVSGTVIDVGEGATQHGHCYGTSASPTISGSKTSMGIAATGDFTSNLTELEPSTTYYVRAYTSLGSEAAYGGEVTFTTASAALPELTTTAITSITKTSAVSGGNITSEGGTPVTARGVCWNVASGPTIENSKTTDGSGTGNFASSITGLTANTKYYVRAYATNSGGTAYGDEISFTTSPEVAVAPTVTTAEVTSITSNSAISGGDVTNEGGAPVTAKGVCWSTTANPTIINSTTTDGTGTGSFVSNLTNLNPGTTYYVRAYATNSTGTSYGNEHSFTTEIVVPTLSTITITSITSTAATSGGNITKDGGSAVTVRGVCWSTLQNPTVDDNHTSDGLGTGTYTSNLTGLTGNTTYYVRAYATNSAGTAYGNELSFNTGAVIPTLTTVAVSSITSTTATSGGEISSDGGSSVTAKGICWSTSANPTIADSKTSDGTGTDPFTSSITGLTPGTTYHVRAYATNSIGTAYGNDISFTTSTVIPTVTTSAITDITSTTATSGGDVTSDGGAAVTARGVCWSTSENPTTDDSKTNEGTGTGSFASSITGLTPGASYHVRAYATNSVGTAYGADLTFTAGAVLSTVTTTAVTDITSSTAVSGGNVTSDGGSTVTTRGVCWSTSASPTTADSKTSDDSGTGSFVSNITGLTPCTTYHVRAYATNSSGTAYGADISFTAGTDLPTVATTSISAITSTAAASGGNVTGNCSETVTAKGVCWSTSPNPTTADSKTNDGTAAGSFISSLSGLTACVTYYVRAYATNSAGTAYGQGVTFNTSTILPTVSTASITGITATSATSGGDVTGDCASSVTAWGVCWSTNPNPTTANSHTTDGSGSGSFVSNMSGLLPGKTYYVRAYATNSAGTSYAGNELNFTTTVVIPTLTTISINSITNTSAGSGGDIISDGGASITARGVCWNTSPDPTVDNSKTTDGIGTGTYTSNLTSLTQNCVYWVRAYATNSAGTGYGNEFSFTTMTSLTTNAVTEITKYTATSGGASIVIGGSAEISVKGVCWDTIPNPTILDNHTNDGAGWVGFTSSLTGLRTNKIYYVRAYATNAGGTAYGNQQSFTSLANVETYGISNITATTASGNGYIEIAGGTGASITARGVCWSTSANPTTADSKTNDGTGTGSFTSSLTGLTSNTRYYVRAYATNEGGTSYGNQQSFTTLAAITTTAVTNITSTMASSGGIIEAGGGESISARGVCWNTSPNPTISNSKTWEGTETGSFTSNLTGLNSNTQYYVRAYVTNAGGTNYGSTDMVFTSLASITTTAISDITSVSASSGGTIEVGGGESITDRGVCWSTSPEPTPDGSGHETHDGSGEGIFISSISGLTPATTYYVRAWANNPGGISYGNQVSFTTTGAIDVDGNAYSAILIGTQLWLKENLKTTKYNNGVSIPEVTDNTAWKNLMTPGFCWYENDQATYKNTYGALYNWYTVNTGLLCPNGWHVPSDADWTTLTNYLGGLIYAGQYLKEAGTTHWSSPNTGATNSTGFTALPGGYRDGANGLFLDIRDVGYWWSTSLQGGGAWYRIMYYNFIVVDRTYYDLISGFSVRCVKD